MVKTQDMHFKVFLVSCGKYGAGGIIRTNMLISISKDLIRSRTVPKWIGLLREKCVCLRPGSACWDVAVAKVPALGEFLDRASYKAYL